MATAYGQGANVKAWKAKWGDKNYNLQTAADTAEMNKAYNDDAAENQAESLTGYAPVAGQTDAQNDSQRAGWLQSKIGGETQSGLQQTDAFKGLVAEQSSLNGKILARGQAQDAAAGKAAADAWAAAHPPGQTGPNEVSDANKPSWATYTAPTPAPSPAPTGSWGTVAASGGSLAAAAAPSPVANSAGGTGSGGTTMASVIGANSGNFDNTNAEHQQGARDLFAAMQSMIAGGNELGAKALYKSKQGSLGFTDADFAMFAPGFTAEQLSSWKGASNFKADNPTHVQAFKDLYAALKTMVTNGDEAGAKALYNSKKSQFGFTDADFAPYADLPDPANNNARTAYATPQQVTEWAGNTTTSTVVPNNPGPTPTPTPTPGPTPTPTPGPSPGPTPTPTPAPYTGTLPPTGTGQVVTIPNVTQVAGTPPPQLGFNLANIGTANTWTVDPQNETVAGQLERILASDNPLMIQARTRALQQQNANGRLNSTMAQSAGDEAMYSAALPIAQADAATYSNASRFNTGEENTFARDSNAFLREGKMADFNLTANDWAANQNQGRSLTQNAIQNQYTNARDANLNNYQMVRDRVQNQYTTARDATANANQTTRDATLNDYQTRRDTTANDYQTTRDATQQTYNLANNAAGNTNQSDAAALTRLAGARSDFAQQLNSVLTNTTIGEQARTDAIHSLQINYNAIIRAAATQLGWKPEDWLIKDEAATIP